MSLRKTFRPECERLERRDVPSGLARRHGHHHVIPIDVTVSGTISGDRLTVRNLHLGRLSGRATLVATSFDPQTGNHSGTLVYHTRKGNLTFSDTGHVNEQAMTFHEDVTVSRGTGSLRGTTGQLTIDGSFDFTGHFTATVTGEITT